MKIGIVGLPNVGKSTLFKAITKKQALIANYPFATIDPSVGVVELKDERVNVLAGISNSKKQVYATVSFVDIAGLVSGAHKGEGLGNQFLAHIREVDALAHVVRAFTDPDVLHVQGIVDPTSDLEIIMLELAMADLTTVEKRLATLVKERTTSEQSIAILTRFKELLSKGESVAKNCRESDEKKLAQELSLLTYKPFFIIVNSDEKDSATAIVEQIKNTWHCPVVPLSGKIEAELSELTPEESAAFMKDYGIKESSLQIVARVGYTLLGLCTYFTSGEPETRAWTITKGMTAPQASGVIHTDFEKLFITAEVTSFEDFKMYNGWSGVRNAGKLRLEGKEYIVADGDVCFFRIGKV